MTEDLGRFFRDERREAELFRKGVVQAIDQSVVPWLATINGRRMPYIDVQLEVGDVVFYVDQPDPFAWARFDALGSIPGNFRSVSFWFGARYAGFNGDFDEVSHSMPQIGTIDADQLPAYVFHWAVSPTGDSILTNSIGLLPVYDNEENGMSLHDGIVLADAAPIPTGVALTTWSPPTDWSATGLFGIDPVSGVYSRSLGALQTGTTFTFPAHYVPGPDWLTIYLLLMPPDFERQAEYEASGTLESGPHWTEDPAAPNMRKFIYSADVTGSYQGDVGAFREWSTEAGMMPARTITSDIAGKFRPMTLVLDTR